MPTGRAQDARSGAGENQFGVKLGDIRGLARTIRTDYALALSLWDTGNVDAQLIATLLVEPDRLSAEAVPEVQWTMNNTLAAIGIHVPGFRQRAVVIGEKLGICRDYSVSKGRTSPFAPIWINAIVSRQG